MANQPTPTPSAPANETPADVVYLGNKRVKARFKWRPHADGPQYTHEAVFDYSKLTEEQLFMLAQDSATIKLQAKLRNAAAAAPGGKLDPRLYQTVDVLADVVTASRSDPIAQMVLAMRKAGVDEKTIEASRLAAVAAAAKKK